MTTRTLCPHCKNGIGFVFGTCSNCGYNYLDKTFHWIVVSAEDITHWELIHKHSIRTKDHLEGIYDNTSND